MALTSQQQYQNCKKSWAMPSVFWGKMTCSLEPNHLFHQVWRQNKGILRARSQKNPVHLSFLRYERYAHQNEGAHSERGRHRWLYPCTQRERQMEAKESPRAVNLKSRVGGDSTFKFYATSCVFFLERRSVLGPLFINDQKPNLWKCIASHDHYHFFSV